MTANASHQNSLGKCSPRVHRIVAAIRAAGVRRNRRAFLIVGTAIVIIAGWHFLPNWKMYALRSACDEISAYRRVNGHFPTSQGELDEALRDGGLFRLGANLNFGKSDLSSMQVVYTPIVEDQVGPGFQLFFNHDCYCKLGDTDRYRYYSSTKSWETWYD